LILDDFFFYTHQTTPVVSLVKLGAAVAGYLIRKGLFSIKPYSAELTCDARLRLMNMKHRFNPISRWSDWPLPCSHWVI